MMIRSFYDYIVLGATLPGVLFAAERSRAGYSVLLTNQYGFPGGNVTEVLNCLQEIPQTSDAVTSELYRSIAVDNSAASVVNPESVKYALQKFLESTQVDLYFHVIPKQITTDTASEISVALLAKEGLTVVRGKYLLDASDELYGARIFGLPLSFGERSINLFTTPPNDLSFLSFAKIRRAEKLDDGRYWLSLRIDSKDELFREDETHQLLDEFRVVLERSGSRIQILPLGVHSQVTIGNGADSNGPLKTVDGLLSRSYGPSEQFVKAAALLENNNTF